LKCYQLEQVIYRALLIIVHDGVVQYRPDREVGVHLVGDLRGKLGAGERTPHAPAQPVRRHGHHLGQILPLA